MILKIIYILLVVSVTNCTTNWNDKSNAVTSEMSEVEEIKKAFNLLSQGEEKIELCGCDEATLVLGITGSGKSTLVQWLFGNNEKLISKEIRRGEYIIEDGKERIGSSSVLSMTLFPELTVDPMTGLAYYDCPGFSDTRSASHEIAITYFIKRITDQGKRIRMLFTVSFPSVKTGVNRHDFRQLLIHVLDFIQDIEKFRNSIALVVTKVDNDYVKVGKGRTATYELVSDDDVVSGIVEFLKQMKYEFEDQLSSSKGDEKFYTKAIQFLNILLIENNKEYSRIGIFRRPDEPGPLNEIILLEENKEILKNLVSQLEFTQKNNTDFGYTISEKSKNTINGLGDEINEKVSIEVLNINSIIKESERVIFEKIEKRIESFLTTALITFDLEESEAENISKFILKTNQSVFSLVEDILHSSSIIDFIETINTTSTSLEINAAEKHMSLIRSSGEFMAFLQIVMDKELVIRSSEWSNLFKITAIYISTSFYEMKNHAANTAFQITDQIKVDIERIIKEIKRQYQNKNQMLGLHLFLPELSRGYDVIKDVTLKTNIATSIGELSEKIRVASKKMNIDVGLINNLISSVLEKEKRILYLQILAEKETITFGLPQLKALVITTEQHFAESLNWYNFLTNLYAKFAEYIIQKNNKFDSFSSINSANYGDFLKKIEHLKIKNLDAVKNIELTNTRSLELNDLNRMTVNNVVTSSCLGNTLVIKGNFIKFSDFMTASGALRTNCGSEIKSVILYTLNTVFIDQDFLAIGKKLQLTIISPKWEIIGIRKIVLDGLSGRYQEKARSGIDAGENGKNGSPGLPGGSSGSFLGIGDFFANGANLKITANGGKGGVGQEGGNGAIGRKGINGECGPNRIEKKCNIDVYAVLYAATICKILHRGERGHKGGNGGNGGKGGIGGNSGNIELHYLKEMPNKSKIYTLNENGNSGENGIGGNFGRGGQEGDMLQCVYEFRMYFLVPIEKLNEKILIPVYSFAESGTFGGINDAIPSTPEPRVVIQEPMKSINEYKNYLIANSKDMFRKSLLNQFYSSLNENVIVKKKYTTI